MICFVDLTPGPEPEPPRHRLLDGLCLMIIVAGTVMSLWMFAACIRAQILIAAHEPVEITESP